MRLCEGLWGRNSVLSVGIAELTLMVAACNRVLDNHKVSVWLCVVVKGACKPSNRSKRVVYQRRCLAAGVLPAVASVLIGHGSTCVTVAREGCETLAALADGNKANADAIIHSTGGLDAILTVMNSYAGDWEFQSKAACVALRTVLSAVGNKAEETSAAVVGGESGTATVAVRSGVAGVIRALVSSMSERAADRVHVARNLCGVLGNLASCNRVHADAIVLSTGGLDAILSLMQVYVENGVFQGWPCFALNKLAEAVSPAALTVMRESRAVELLNTAKRNFPTDVGSVQRFADAALARLAP